MTRGTASHGTVLVAHPGAELYGSDRVLLETVSALVDTGRRVVVTLPLAGPLVELLRERGAAVVISVAPVLRKSALRPSGMPRFLSDVLLGLVRGTGVLRRERPTLVFVNTVTIPLWILIAWLRGVPVICHVHEGEASASAILRTALALPLLFANRVIANSHFSVGVLRRSFRRLGREARVVYNAVPGPPTPAPARISLDGSLRVAYIGRLSPRKGVDIALSAVALLRDEGMDAELDLYGAVFPGYESYEQELRNRVAQLGLTSSVRFHGFLKSVWPGIASSDVVVVPSRADEPFGNTAIEAILGGRPVVASATSGLLEATSGYAAAQQVTPNDPRALADALSRVAEEWSTMRRHAETDIQRAQSRHSPAAYGAQIIAVVAELGVRA